MIYLDDTTQFIGVKEASERERESILLEFRFHFSLKQLAHKLEAQSNEGANLLVNHLENLKGLCLNAYSK